MANSARLDELKKKFDENPRRYFAPLANEYRKQGDLAQAIALCRTHLPNQPGHISGHIVLAQALYESRELAEARQAFELSLDLDPENLIALRYLGDIAREQGAPASAQAWYQRVLEVDPRNEEIAQLLREVEVEAAQAVADLATRPTPPVNVAISEHEEVRESALESLAGRDFSTSSVESVVIEPPRFEIEPAGSPESLDPFGDFGSPAGTEPEAITDDWFTQAAHEAPAAPADPVLPDLTAAHSLPTPAESGDDLFESFSMEWAQAEPSVEATPAPVAEAPVDDLSAPAPMLDVEAESAAAPLEFEPEVVAYSEPETVAIEAPDEVTPPASSWEESAPRSTTPVWNQLVESPEPDLGAIMDFVDEPVEALAAADTLANPEALVEEALPQEEQAEDDEPVEAVAAEPVVAAESVVSNEVAEALVDEVLVEVDMATDDQDAVDSDPLIGRTPAFGSLVQEEPPAPFVTETMAELYLQQGFNEEALAIYRQLLQQNPGDDTLRQRVAALEEGSSSTVVTPLAPPVVTPVGPSVRSFFARFAQRQPGAGGNGGEDAPTINGAASADEGLTRADDPSATLPDVFGRAEVAPGDEQAAAALASAFGLTATEATAELSLDSLFRDVPARADAAVTSSGAGEAAPAAIGGESGEPQADIEQFTAWLEGLKKK